MESRKAEAIYEVVSHEADCSFKLGDVFSSCILTPWHFHPEVELSLVVSSRGQRFVGDSIENFEPGDLVLLGPNLPHTWRNTGPIPGTQDYAHTTFAQFSTDFLGTPFMHAPEMREISDLLDRARCGLAFGGKTRRRAGEAIRRLTGVSGLERLFGLLQILSMLASSTDVRCLSSEGFSPEFDGKSEQRATRCFQYIFDHINEPISLEEVASVANMSLHSFCRYFKKISGKTLSTFICEVRIGQACHFLLETDMNIAEICYTTGFNSLSYFNRRFRELHKCSPREWRKLYLDVASEVS